MRNKTVNRWIIYLVGMLLLTLGLYLNARCGLGTSALLSVAFVGSQVWDISFGNASLVVYFIYVALQFVVRGKHRKWSDLLQIPVGLAVSQTFNLLDRMLPYARFQDTLGSQLLVLACALLLIGVGTSLSVNMHLVPTPGDGIVQALADRFHKEQGLMKNITDCTCVALATIMSLLLCGRLVGVGLGTVAAMLGVGRVVWLTNKLVLDKIRAAAGLTQASIGGKIP